MPLASIDADGIGLLYFYASVYWSVQGKADFTFALSIGLLQGFHTLTVVVFDHSLSTHITQL